MIEKRKFVRLRAPIEIAYFPVKKHKHQRHHRTFLRDISGTGLSMIAKDDLRVGDLIKLEIHVPHLEDCLDAVGEVVWFSFSRDKEWVSREAGVRFRDISASDLKQILEYVYMIGIG